MKSIRISTDLPQTHPDYVIEKIKDKTKVYDFYFLRYGGYVVDASYLTSTSTTGVTAPKRADVLDIFKRFDYHNYDFFDVNDNTHYCNGVVRYAYEQIKRNKSSYPIVKRMAHFK